LVPKLTNNLPIEAKISIPLQVKSKASTNKIPYQDQWNVVLHSILNQFTFSQRVSVKSISVYFTNLLGLVNFCWPSPAQWFLLPIPAGLLTTCYCLTALRDVQPPPPPQTLYSSCSRPPKIFSCQNSVHIDCLFHYTLLSSLSWASL
jgi:hypothetical protein